MSDTPAAGNTRSSTDASGGAPRISLPKGGGAIRGIGETFTAQSITGTASLASRSPPVLADQALGRRFRSAMIPRPATGRLVLDGAFSRPRLLARPTRACPDMPTPRKNTLDQDLKFGDLTG